MTSATYNSVQNNTPEIGKMLVSSSDYIVPDSFTPPLKPWYEPTNLDRSCKGREEVSNTISLLGKSAVRLLLFSHLHT